MEIKLYIYIYIMWKHIYMHVFNLFIYLFGIEDDIPHSTTGNSTSPHAMKRRKEKRDKNKLPFKHLKLWLVQRKTFTSQGCHTYQLWHLVEVRGSYPGASEPFLFFHTNLPFPRSTDQTTSRTIKIKTN